MSCYRLLIASNWEQIRSSLEYWGQGEATDAQREEDGECGGGEQCVAVVQRLVSRGRPDASGLRDSAAGADFECHALGHGHGSERKGGSRCRCQGNECRHERELCRQNQRRRNLRSARTSAWSLSCH